MTKWDREKIIAALLDRRSNGLPLNAGALNRSCSGLYRAAVDRFGSYDAALVAAGIEPAAVRLTSRWDPARVVAAIRARQDAGLKLNRHAVNLEEARLAVAADRCFGSWGAALQAAGINPEAVSRAQRWDKARIVSGLRECLASGMALNAETLCKSNRPLYRAAASHFASYSAALRAAGVDPEAVRRKRHWSRPSIIKALRERRAAGLALNAQAVSTTDQGLYQAAHAYFESYDAALRAAGIDSAQVRKAVAWDKAKISAALRERMNEGLEMNYRAICASNPALGVAIHRHFGSHDNALRACGLDPDLVRKCRPMPDDDALFDALRAIAQNGAASHKMIFSANPRLVHLSRQRFGTLEAAVKAAGLRYFHSQRVNTSAAAHWTEERVIRALRGMHEEGQDLRYRAMKTRYQPLFFAAKEIFGSYVNAVKQAGINYWEMSQAQLAKERAAARPPAKDGPE